MAIPISNILNDHGVSIWDEWAVRREVGPVWLSVASWPEEQR